MLYPILIIVLLLALIGGFLLGPTAPTGAIIQAAGSASS